MAFFAQRRAHLDFATVLPRLFALSSASCASKRAGGGGETGDWSEGCEREAGDGRLGVGVLETGEGLASAWEYGESTEGAAAVGEGGVRRSSGSVAEQALMWMAMEAARLLIRSKLRSSFGGPVHTFEALEHMLLEACTRAEMDGQLMERVSGGGGGGGGGEAQAAQAGGVVPRWHRALRMLLLFVGHLERLVFSAYEGSVALPVCSATSVKFFRGNRKVCVQESAP
jgi:hypothetical protein